MYTPYHAPRKPHTGTRTTITLLAQATSPEAVELPSPYHVGGPSQQLTTPCIKIGAITSDVRWSLGLVTVAVFFTSAQNITR